MSKLVEFDHSCGFKFKYFAGVNSSEITCGKCKEKIMLPSEAELLFPVPEFVSPAGYDWKNQWSKIVKDCLEKGDNSIAVDIAELAGILRELVNKWQRF